MSEEHWTPKVGGRVRVVSGAWMDMLGEIDGIDHTDNTARVNWDGGDGWAWVRAAFLAPAPPPEPVIGPIECAPFRLENDPVNDARAERLQRECDTMRELLKNFYSDTYIDDMIGTS